MAKTYNSIPTVATGDLLTATAWNNQATNVNNYRVPPMCRVYRNAAIPTLGSGSTYVIPWDTESFTQTDSGMWASSPNPTRITPQTAGVYLFVFEWGFAGNNSGIRRGFIRLNGSTTIALNNSYGNAGYSEDHQTIAMRAMNGTTDYVECTIFQDSGSSIIPSSGDPAMSLSVTWLGQVS